MKKIIVLSLLLFHLCTCSSQYYDLIIKKSGDSIACKIDSISSTKYFFKLQSHGKWIHTHIDKTDVLRFERDTIDKKTVAFISGTSIIDNKASASINTYPGTTLFLELGGKGYGAANIDFKITRGHRIGINIGINPYSIIDDSGMNSEEKVIPSLGFMYYYIKGKKYSFFELGIGMSCSVRLDFEYASISDVSNEKSKDSPLVYYGVIGYRYQKPDGLLFRVGFTPIVNPESYFLPVLGLSFGYSF